MVFSFQNYIVSPVDSIVVKSGPAPSFADATSTFGGPDFRLIAAGGAALCLSPVGKDNLFFAGAMEALSGASASSFDKLWKRDLALADSVGAM